MTIALYVPSLAKNSNSSSIVGTFFPLLDHLNEHQIVLITDDKTPDPAFSKFPIYTLKPRPRYALLKKFWIENALAKLLQSIKADLFISTDNFCVLKASIPQCLVVTEPESLKLPYAKKAKSLIVPDQMTREAVADKLKTKGDNISIVHPFPAANYGPVNSDIRNSIKARYTEEREFFLFPGPIQSEDEFKNLLKAYSHFKKRQQSSFKLMILSGQEWAVKKMITTYKYRNDVVFLSSINDEENALLIASAYAVLLPFEAANDKLIALNTLRSSVPLISISNSPVSEVVQDAGLYASNEIKDIGEKLMLIYKDESLRSSLIQKGNLVVQNFSPEASANQLRLSIMKAMN